MEQIRSSPPKKREEDRRIPRKYANRPPSDLSAVGTRAFWAGLTVAMAASVMAIDYSRRDNFANVQNLCQTEANPERKISRAPHEEAPNVPAGHQTRTPECRIKPLIDFLPDAGLKLMAAHVPDCYLRGTSKS